MTEIAMQIMLKILYSFRTKQNLITYLTALWMNDVDKKTVKRDGNTFVIC